MNRHRANVHIFTLLLMMILRLIDQFDHATRHLRHLTLNRWPTVILKLGHFYGVLHLTVGHIEFASRVIRTTFTLHVLDHNVLVLDFIVGPIARTFLWSVTNLTKDNNCFFKRHTSGKTQNYLCYHNDSVDAMLGNHTPEITDRLFHRILCDDKRFRVVVAFDERRIYVGAMITCRDWRQNHTIPIEWYHQFAAIFMTVLVTVSDRTRFIRIVRN